MIFSRKQRIVLQKYKIEGVENEYEAFEKNSKVPFVLELLEVTKMNHFEFISNLGNLFTISNIKQVNTQFLFEFIDEVFDKYEIILDEKKVLKELLSM